MTVRVGMVGGGQLARMTYQAGIPLGLTLRVLAADAEDSAGLVGADVELGSPDDPPAMRRFAAGCDVVTFDHELVAAASLIALSDDGVVLRPHPEALRYAQDKRHQRERFAAAGLPVPAHRPVVAGADDIEAFAAEHGWPVVVKAVSGGYDGRGVWVVGDQAQGQRLASEAAGRGVELLAEEHVTLDAELAVQVARRPGGELVVYPAVESVQIDGICHEVLAPAPVPAATAAAAVELGTRVAELTDAVGVIAVELFLSDGKLLVNEVATRPHNSGHYSIDGCTTSQFENHLRAVLDWPLGATDLLAPAVAMANVLGGPQSVAQRDVLPRVLADPDARVHLYGKKPRPGRKLGHVTVCGDDLGDVRARAQRAAALLAGAAQEVHA
jgi:5-(carboxyamino)imidazole ribonucleotide synthase